MEDKRMDSDPLPMFAGAPDLPAPGYADYPAQLRKPPAPRRSLRQALPGLRPGLRQHARGGPRRSGVPSYDNSGIATAAFWTALAERCRDKNALLVIISDHGSRLKEPHKEADGLRLDPEWPKD